MTPSPFFRPAWGALGALTLGFGLMLAAPHAMAQVIDPPPPPSCPPDCDPPPPPPPPTCPPDCEPPPPPPPPPPPNPEPPKQTSSDADSRADEDAEAAKQRKLAKEAAREFTQTLACTKECRRFIDDDGNIRVEFWGIDTKGAPMKMEIRLTGTLVEVFLVNETTGERRRGMYSNEKNRADGQQLLRFNLDGYERGVGKFERPKVWG